MVLLLLLILILLPPIQPWYKYSYVCMYFVCLFQSGVCWSAAKDSGVNEQTETTGEGHGDQLLQDITGKQHSHRRLYLYSSTCASSFAFCLWFPHMFALTFLFSVCLPGPENSDSSLSGSDVSSQRSCADWTLSVVWSCVSPRLPLTSVSHSLEIILVGFIKIIWKKKRKEK